MPVAAPCVERAVRDVDGQARIVITAKPKAAREGVVEGRDGALVVAVGAPADEGRANARIVEVMAEALGVSRGRVRIVRGETARHKELAVDGISAAVVVARLSAPRP